LKRQLTASRFLLCALLQFAVLAGVPALCPAEDKDKNGVTPNTISLPSGPGSIEGLGESFQPMLNTGTAKYAVPIALPAGVSGHTPTLALAYESGLGDGPAGIGWTFGPGSVSRRTDRGIPRYVDGPNGQDEDEDGEIDEPDENDKLVGLEGEDLVELADGTFRARIEGTFIRYRRVGDHWEAHLKDGTRLEFGTTPETRVADATGSKIFRWLLERSTDTNGNEIEFSYAAFPDSDNRKYLQEIRYGPGPAPWAAFYFACLTYEDRPDWRKDFRSGFLVKTAKRLARIDIGIQGALPDKCAPGDWNDDGTTDALIRRYELAYDQTQTRYSLLSDVTLIGSDGVNYLPPMSFSYSTFEPDTTVSASGLLIESRNTPTTVMDSDLVELIDLNRDGLPDLLQTDLYGGRHTGYFNLGMTRDQGGGSPEIDWDQGRTVSSPDGRAQLLHLADDWVHLADMDGDGISDLIQTTYPWEVYYHLNQGDGSWGERKKMSLQDTAPPAPYQYDNAKTSDLDFDKRMDVVMSTEAGYRVWFNLAEGRYSEEVTTAGARHEGRVLQFSYSGVHLADMNGDRLSDVARIRPATVIYCAGMGYSHFADSVEIPIPDTVLKDGANSQVARARLEDLNGDGLADLVVERAEANELWYWLNLGTHAFPPRHVVTDMPTLLSPSTATRWADLNGNGTTDLVYADSKAASRIVALDISELAGGSGAARPNLLTGIDNGLGARTTITYRSSTEYCNQAREEGEPWSSTVPFPVWVVAEVRTTTGLDVDLEPGEDEYVDEYVKEFIYRDGFYEDRLKAFRGFEEARVIEHGVFEDESAPTRVTVHRFFTGGPDGVDNDGDGDIDEVTDRSHREEDALKGMVRSLAVRADDGTLFSEETNDWLVRNLAVSVDEIEVRLAYNQATEKLLYEGTGTPETLLTTYVYDDFGNVTEERDFGALSITGDEVFTFTEYINKTNPNETDPWMIGLPARRYTTDSGGQTFAETLSYYDGPDYVGLAFGEVDRGDLTRQEGWVEGSIYVNLVRSAYDTYGNIVGILDPNGHSRTIVYDDTLHAFPTEEHIEVGGGRPDLTVTAAYNLGLGVPTSSVGFNGHQTLYGHDVFGRLTSIVSPGDSTLFPTLAFTYTMADPAASLLYSYDAEGALSLTSGASAPSSVATRAREVSGQAGTLDTVAYVDGLGRKLATVAEAEQGFVVQEAVLFNALGTVHSAFLPYSAVSAAYAPPTPGLPAVVTEYDAPGREVLKKNPPDTASEVTSAATQYLPLARIVTDENGVSKTFYSDGLERLAEVHEQNQGETYVTQYAYDPLGNLTQITDAQNNVKTFEYDALSRKTALNDPDRGRMDYTYDPAGNLIETEDNKGQTIVYTYDGANRPLTEDFLDAAMIVPDVAFHYDAPSPGYPFADNTKGRLAWVEDLSGGAFFSYDARGNTAWSVKRIAFQGSTLDFRSEADYDALGRVTAATFPDGDRVEYTYNNRSLLESIPGIVSAIDYLPSGQPGAYSYANGLTTTYSYDPRNRLTHLVTDRTAPTGSPIQDLTYTFDGVSNITQIADARILPPDSPRNASQNFQYDDLYRLTRAEGPGYGAITFQYDRIGNLTSKKSPDLPNPEHIDDDLINLGAVTSGGAAGTSGRESRSPGDPPGPHAVTGTDSGLAFDYDDNGNMTDHAGDAYEWDFKDRLIRTTTPEGVSEYVYDSGGQRVVKKSSSGGTDSVVYYVSDGFEIRDGTPVKFVFDASRRVARVEGRLDSGTGEASQVLTFQTGWNFFSLQVEPQDPAIATVLAPIEGRYTDVWAFDAASHQYQGYVPGEGITDLTELHALRGYIIYVTAPAGIVVTGTRATGDIALEAGSNLIACPTGTAVAVTEALASIAGDYDEVWAYDTATKTWSNLLVGQPDFLSNLEVLQPGRAYWVKMNKPATLSTQLQTKNLHYYHPDHLGSSNVVTDTSGTVVESTEFYPYGRPRHEERIAFNSAYKYTGKELDRATGLMYYEARYYEPVVGRFISVDPLAENPPSTVSGWLIDPQSLNSYAYTQNNPVKYIDPLGKDLTITGTGMEQHRIRTALEQLTGHQVLIGAGGRVQLGDPTRAGEKRIGTKLVRELIASEQEVTIDIEREKGRGSHISVGTEKGKLVRAVHFDPTGGKLRKIVGNLETREGRLEEEKHPFISLGHELIHGHRAVRGVYIPREGPSAESQLNMFMVGTEERVETQPMEELETVGIEWSGRDEDITENMLREEHGLAARIAYGARE